MFTDIMGFTALGQRNESLSLALVDEQRKLIRPILTRHNGREIKTIGDAFLVTFPNALDAVRCAYDIQRATREFNISLPAERRIHLRVGLHLGDIVESADDISGDAVNVASRIEPLAEDGGVCLTRQVYDQVHSKFDLPIVSMGAQSLKNVIGAQEIFKIEMPWGRTEHTGDQAVSERIAVLPFASLSPAAEDEYFADGMTEEVISTLSRIRGVEVISRTSVMQYKKTLKPARDVSRELNAGTLLEGSVRKAGNRIRVTVQMIDAPRDRHVWAESYDREVQDVFAIQSDIAQRVAAALEQRLLEGEAERLERGLTKNVQAYDEYLRGLYEAHRMSDYSLRNCISHLEAAVNLDNSFAAAYASLGNAYVHSAGMEGVDPGPAYSRAKEVIEKALALDESLSSAHAARANLAAQCDSDWELTGKELRRAIELNPSNSEAHRYYATLLAVLNRTEESEREALKARDLDPLWWFNEIILAWYYVAWRRYDEAVVHARRGVDLDPSNPNALLELGRVYCWTGMFDEALEQLTQSLSMKDTLECRAVLAKTYAKKGMPEEARSMLGEIERDARLRYFSPFARGEIYLALGDRDRAFELFNQASENRSFDFVIDHHSPDLDTVRQDPRYLDLLRRYNLGS
jgi:adenylate cyclase